MVSSVIVTAVPSPTFAVTLLAENIAAASPLSGVASQSSSVKYGQPMP